MARSVAFLGVSDSGLASWAWRVGEAAEDGGVRSRVFVGGMAELETSLAESCRGAGRECCDVVELCELLSNEVTGRTCGEDTGDIEGRVG